MLNENNSCNCLSALKKQLSLSDRDIKMMSDNKKEIYYEEGETIVKQGAEATHILILKKGIALLRLEENKKKRIIQLVNQEGFAVLPAIFFEDIYSYSVKSITPTIICQIKKDLFYQIVKSNSKAVGYLLKWYNLHVNMLYDLLRIDLVHNNMGKIAFVLKYLNSFINCDYDVLQYVTRDLIAEMAGISAESTGKIIADLKKENIIDIRSSGLKIKNVDKLLNICKVG